MTDAPPRTATAFIGRRRLAAGPLAQVALAVKAAEREGPETILVFDDADARVIDLDLRGTDAEVTARLSPAPVAEDTPAAPRGRGRPKLGVTAREVTLLPRHWDWLAAQPGGASAALRRLVEEARRASGPRDQARSARDAAYRFMSALAGDLPGYEEAIRALFADDRAAFEGRTAPWPDDVRDYSRKLAFGTSEG